MILFYQTKVGGIARLNQNTLDSYEISFKLCKLYYTSFFRNEKQIWLILQLEGVLEYCIRVLFKVTS